MKKTAQNGQKNSLKESRWRLSVQGFAARSRHKLITFLFFDEFCSNFDQISQNTYSRGIINEPFHVEKYCSQIGEYKVIDIFLTIEKSSIFRAQE